MKKKFPEENFEISFEFIVFRHLCNNYEEIFMGGGKQQENIYQGGGANNNKKSKTDVRVVFNSLAGVRVMSNWAISLSVTASF